MTQILISQIADILEEMDKEKNVDHMLSSEGKNFCAGADFSKSNFTSGENIYEDLY